LGKASELHAARPAMAPPVMVELERTPRISTQVGRDHWPQVNFAILAGGKMKSGLVIGTTDRIAGRAVSRPVKFGKIYATVYKNLGIDVESTWMTIIEG
jgi:hypothetical protein